MDILTPEQRSRHMAGIKNKDTKPEKTVRSLLHAMGFRFRLHRKDLPGRPDIVLPKHKTVIFVHGCFWHAHKNCRKATVPSSNTDFWRDKLAANKVRDQANIAKLQEMGWQVVVVWECQTKDMDALASRLAGIAGARTT